MTAAETHRRLEGEYLDERLPTLTNRSSRSNEKEPASGPRQRSEVDLYGLWSDEPEMESYLHLIQNAYFTPDGAMIAIPEEEEEEALVAQHAVPKARVEANEARASAVRATARARQAEAKAAKLAEKLRALGVDSDKLT